MESNIYENIHIYQNKAGVVMLILDKVEFRRNTITTGIKTSIL